MQDIRTLNILLEKFRNPEKKDYESFAVSLIKNFSIIKNEVDSFGARDVKYRIADLEIYLYSTIDEEDAVTINRDCVEGQWFIHRYGVDLAFRTLRGENGELIKFGGILIRGLEKYENNSLVGNICGCQRCMLDMFNATNSLPKLVQDKPQDNIEIYNTDRIESSPLPYRYFKKGVDWKMRRKLVFQTQKTENSKTEYHIWHAYKDLPKEFYNNMPIITNKTKRIYPESL